MALRARRFRPVHLSAARSANNDFSVKLCETLCPLAYLLAGLLANEPAPVSHHRNALKGSGNDRCRPGRSMTLGTAWPTHSRVGGHLVRPTPTPGKVASDCYPRNRTSCPHGVPSTSSSRITACPRTMVATGQPVMSMPANGVQPQGETIHDSSIFRCRFMSTKVKSAS